MRKCKHPKTQIVSLPGIDWCQVCGSLYDYRINCWQSPMIMFQLQQKEEQIRQMLAAKSWGEDKKDLLERGRPV